MANPNPQRRTFLRGALAAGAALMLLGCQKQDERAPVDDTAPPAPSGSTSMDDTLPATPGTSGPMGDTAPTSPNDVPPPGDAAPAAAPPASDAATAGATKVSKAQAQYQGTPKGDQKCSNCTFFIADTNTCKVVEGEVSPNGWSALWAPV